MLGRFDPFGELMEDFLKGAFARPAFAATSEEPARRARIDVLERNGDYVVLADLPGTRKDDIHVQVVGDEVSISAEAKKEIREGERVMHAERALGKFARSFSLPEEIDEQRVTAKFADGVLELTLPKKAPAASRKITIQ